ncbi:hypothetical protein F4780DRAFT_728090 [Xylariomycetidae sp. FL0641]|nr:hypothetical protein F4780DRAFT_728090 [Xylariomycetidae sp. FL0641]
MQFSALSSLALFALGAAAQSCSTRDDCPGDQVCARLCEYYASYCTYTCMEPSSACCGGDCGACGGESLASGACDVFGNPGDFDDYCT